MAVQDQTQNELNKELAICKTKIANFEAFRENCRVKCSKYSLFASIVAHSDDAILSEDLNGNILSWNNGAKKIYGYSENEIVSSNISILMPDGKKNEIPWIFKKIKNKETIKNYETLRKTKDGRIINVSLSISPIFNFQNEVSGAAVIARDITDRKELEASLKKSEERFRNITAAAGEFIWEIDLAGRFTFVSKPIEKVLGYKTSEILGRTPFEFMHEDDAQRFRGLLLPKFIAAGKFKNIEHRFRSKKGNITWHMASAFASRKNNEITGFYGMTIDITEKVAAEKMKEEIDYIMRHDLKAPLNGIIGLPALLREADNLTEEQKSLLEIIENAGYQMLRMINNSLDIYKLEKGIYSLDPAPVDILSVIHNISMELSSLIQDKDLKFKIENENGKKEFIAAGEKLLFYSMFGNLIKNAIEASPENETICVKLKQLEGNAVVSIVNKGVISREIRDKFFQKYVTAGKAHGTGIGTYSASLIADVHNGRIDFSCDDASNTTVLDVILPLKYKKKAGHKQ